MRIDEMTEMVHIEEDGNFDEIQTHALISIAASLKLILSVIQDK